MKHFIQYWPSGKSWGTLFAGMFFAFVALDIRCWGLLVNVESADGGGIVFWPFLLLGIAAILGSAAALAYPSLVLSADKAGITFGGASRMRSPEVRVSWKDIRRIELGTFALQSTRTRQPRNVVALSIECDPSINLTGCGDNGNFLVGTVAEICVRTNSRHVADGSVERNSEQSRNLALIDSGYFDVSLHSVKEQLEILWKSAR